MVDVYAKPADRDQISLYVREIETDHKAGPDGNLVAYDRIVFGKQGTNGYEQIYPVERLKKDNPMLWAFAEPLYEQWKKHQTLVRDGLSLKAWSAITKGQIKACEGLGLFTVEDIAKATSSIREKLGMGANELVETAKAFVANKEGTAHATKIAALEKMVADQAAALEEARATMDKLAAQAGKRPTPPKKDAA